MTWKGWNSFWFVVSKLCGTGVKEVSLMSLDWRCLMKSASSLAVVLATGTDFRVVFDC